MKINMDELLDSMLEGISNMDYVRSEDIPNIELYMDQVTSFMDEQLSSSKRYDDDKILTKTMINNYAKNNLLPPPVKKKYSKEHVVVMIFIYYFKTILSIKDIETILTPITEKYFDTGSDVDVASIYEEVCDTAKSQIQNLKDEVREAYETSQNTFKDMEGLSDSDREYLQLFSLISSLSFDVYAKKALIERIIDELPEKVAIIGYFSFRTNTLSGLPLEVVLFLYATFNISSRSNVDRKRFALLFVTPNLNASSCAVISFSADASKADITLLTVIGDSFDLISR